jgi:hypothetical protein
MLIGKKSPGGAFFGRQLRYRRQKARFLPAARRVATPERVAPRGTAEVLERILRAPSPWAGDTLVNVTLAIGPLIALIAGILILIVPRLLNYIVAIYLIVIGLLGLFGGSLHL